MKNTDAAPVSAPILPPSLPTGEDIAVQDPNLPQASDASIGSNSRIEPVLLNAEQTKVALMQAKETHHLVIEWIRSSDAKISPLLTAAGALIAGCLAVLGQQTSMLTHRPVTQALLGVTLLPLIVSLLYAICTVSPTLRWHGKPPTSPPANPKKTPLKPIGFTVTPQHRPVKPESEPLSLVYFGHIALQSRDEFVESAKAASLNEVALLEDLLRQIHINAQIAVDKTSDIAHSARYLIVAVFFLILCGLTFALKL